MARSLSLTAYLTYARRATKVPPAPKTARPKGDLVWAHASDANRAEALIHLAQRFEQQRPGVHILLTTNAGVTPEFTPGGMVIWQELAEDTIVVAEVFLNHWQPDICLWAGGDLHPALLIHADRMGVPLYLLDVDESELTKPSWRWFPDLPKALLGRFNQIMVQTVEAAMHLHRISAGDIEIHVTGPLHEGAIALPYDRSVRDELATIMRGRPIWLTSRLMLDELETVLDAHAQISRLSHRSLLIIVPENEVEKDGFEAQLKARNWRYVLWSEGHMPGETTQVVLASSCDDLGLWYALSPISFMGCSLESGMTGHDPNEPAAHGSAIIYGPNVGRYLGRYSNYAKAGAARLVHDTSTLTAALQNLIAPDQSAMMAHAAWDVVSKSAAVTDMIIDLMQDRLDSEETSK